MSYTQPAPRPPARPPKASPKPKRTQGLSYKRKAPEPSRWSGFAVAPAAAESRAQVAARNRGEAKANVKSELEDACMWPGCREPGLEVHHLIPVGVRPDLAADEDNQLTFCPRHHQRGKLNMQHTPELMQAGADIYWLRREYRQRQQACPIEVIHNRLYVAWGQILRRATPRELPRYLRYLRLKPWQVAQYIPGCRWDGERRALVWTEQQTG